MKEKAESRMRKAECRNPNSFMLYALGFPPFLPAFRFPLSAFCWRLFLAISMACIPAGAEDRILLRDFTVLREPGVTSLSADGVVLARERPGGGKRVGWEEIERIKVADEALQAEADDLREKIGDPLYRLRVRLEVGDYAGLLEPSQSLEATFHDQRSPSALLVHQSLVWGHLAQGQREQAVAPWLRAYEILRTRSAKLGDLPGPRKPQIDAAHALLGELELVWFDAEAARAALPDAKAALETLAEPVPPGARLYVASLALTAGELETATGYLRETEESIPVQQVLMAQHDLLEKRGPQALARLQNVLVRLDQADVSKTNASTGSRPLALYWLGRARLASDDTAMRREGLLTLMQIPALEGNRSPELAAAALFEVAEAYPEDKPLQARLYEEIRNRFPATWHARKLRAAARPSPSR